MTFMTEATREMCSWIGAESWKRILEPFVLGFGSSLVDRDLVCWTRKLKWVKSMAIKALQLPFGETEESWGICSSRFAQF